jgi:hypothetical protein
LRCRCLKKVYELYKAPHHINDRILDWEDEYITMPCILSPQNLGKFGMYRNHSLNTALDRSKV